MSFLLKAIIVFILMLLTDLVWSVCVKWVADEKLVKGGLMAALILVLNGFATISYVSDPWLIFPAAVGAFCGVVLSKYIKR